MTAPLMVRGSADPNTLAQMYRALSHPAARYGVLCADNHLGYAHPIGGVIAYEDHISLSGVGFDIGCGNTAVRLDRKVAELGDLEDVADLIAKNVSFGLGRVNETKVESWVFDDFELTWKDPFVKDLRDKAVAQFGTVGSGNHYVDVFADDEGQAWIGVHFGSRGLGHTIATRFLKEAGGKDGMNVPATVLPVFGELGTRYLLAMHLAGNYAASARNWVVEHVMKLLGAQATYHVNNHHNFAWYEDGLWVVRKGATPNFPDQESFVGGSMGDSSFILRGKSSPGNQSLGHSTIHGAGRAMSRGDARRNLSRDDWQLWMMDKNVIVRGGDIDESPMSYKRIDDVLASHTDTVDIVHRLQPVIAVMAGRDITDPFKD